MMFRRTRRTGAIALLVAVAVGTSACGSSGSSDDAGPTTTTVVTTSQEPPSTSAITPSSPDLSASDPPGVTQPFIDHVQWVQTPQGPSLQVFPTPSGRAAQAPADEGLAWTEVVDKAHPAADTPGMQAQFNCHWEFARIVAPNKPSWNLEPWRPVVSYADMIAARCNPGGPDI